MTRGDADRSIRTHGLRKVYAPVTRARRRDPSPERPGRTAQGPDAEYEAPDGVPIVALDHLDLDVGSGEFFGLLGPNGAGKTTTIGILTTRVRATAGEATVGGADVVRDPVAVRQRIGVVPQRPNPDRSLSVLQNLVFHASYFGFPHREATLRSRHLLDRLGIGERSDARVDHLSGGQQQRLMIARALVHEPAVIFLDEPTVGLDPQARLGLWEILRSLRADGTTLILTTHYMEEADRLCDRVAIVDQGRLLACDTPANLKRQAPGGTLLELHLEGQAAPLLDTFGALPGVLSVEGRENVIRVVTDRGGEMISTLVGAATSAGRAVRDLQIIPPSLESLFISLTGRRME